MNAAGLVLARGAESARDRVGADAARHGLRAAREGAALRLSRLLQHRLLDQRQAERARRLDSARISAGAEIRDLAMVGRIEMGARRARDRRALSPGGRAGASRRRSNVVVAGYAIETPRLLLNSACPQFPDGLANSSGLVGTNLMTHAGPGVWATIEEEIRWYKGPPNMAVTEHWNYTDEGKDFHGGYAYMSQGPLPRGWAQTLSTGTAACGARRCAREMLKYNHTAGFVLVGETVPRSATASSLPTRPTSSACASRA